MSIQYIEKPDYYHPVTYQNAHNLNTLSKIPSFHNLLSSLGPQQFVFLFLDTVVTTMFVLVTWQLSGAHSLLSGSLILIAILFYTMYPLIAIPEYELLLRNNVEVVSFSMYFILTFGFGMLLTTVVDGPKGQGVDWQWWITIVFILLYWLTRHFYMYRGLREEMKVLERVLDEDPISEEQITLDELE